MEKKQNKHKQHDDTSVMHVRCLEPTRKSIRTNPKIKPNYQSSNGNLLLNFNKKTHSRKKYGSSFTPSNIRTNNTKSKRNHTKYGVGILLRKSAVKLHQYNNIKSQELPLPVYTENKRYSNILNVFIQGANNKNHASNHRREKKQV